MTHPGIDVIRTALSAWASNLDADITVAERRANLEALAGAPLELPGVTITREQVAGRPAERFVPNAGVSGPGTVLYLHGGGYISGSLSTHRRLAAELAIESARTVVSLDYRLGPEHPFPAAVDDAVAAALELAAVGPFVVAGDSAGGGLTLATLVALRDAGGPQPVAALMYSPWTDLTQSGASHTTRLGIDPMLTAADLGIMASNYLGDHDATDPLASPLGADLSGLPPMRIDVGDAEVLLDDSVALADRVHAAGGSAELTVWPEMIHVFPAFPTELVPEAGECRALSGAFLARHLV